MDVERLGVAHVVRTPDPVDQLSASQHPPAVAHQVFQQVELLERQRDGVTVHRDDMALHIHANRPGLQHAIAHLRVVVAATAQHRADACDQLACRIGLGHVVVSAQLQADHLVDLAIPGGHHDHRNAGPSAQLLAYIGTRHPRQHQIEQDDVGAGPVELGESCRTIGHHRGLKALLAQQKRQRIGQRLLVLHNQHTGHQRHSSSSLRSASSSAQVISATLPRKRVVPPPHRYALHRRRRRSSAQLFLSL